MAKGTCTFVTKKKSMSNYCGTDYHIYGDKAAVADLYKRMCTITTQKEKSSYWKGYWMGYLAEAFNLKTNEYYCRGCFDFLHLGDDSTTLSFYVESANSPCTELMDHIISRYRRLTMLWFISCDDDGEYFTNDREGRVFKDRYEVVLEDIDSRWFATIAEAVEWIKQQTGITIPPTIVNNEQLLYEYITNDQETTLSMYCNLHTVTIL